MPKKRTASGHKGSKGRRSGAMTADQVMKCLEWENAMAAGTFFSQAAEGGHHDKHVRKTLTETMDEQLRKTYAKVFAGSTEHEIPATSVFDEHFDAEKAITETIRGQLPRIARWHQYAKPGDKFSLYTHMGYDIGSGFEYQDGKLTEKSTDTMSIALKKTNTPLGLELTTAYPNIKDPGAEERQENLTALVSATDTIKKLESDPASRPKAAVLKAMASSKMRPMDLQYEELGGQESMKIKKQMENGLTAVLDIGFGKLGQSYFYCEDENGKKVLLNESGALSKKTKNPNAAAMTYHREYTHAYSDIRQIMPAEAAFADRLQTNLFPDEMEIYNRAFADRLAAAKERKAAKMGTQPRLMAEPQAQAQPVPSRSGPEY